MAVFWRESSIKCQEKLISIVGGFVNKSAVILGTKSSHCICENGVLGSYDDQMTTQMRRKSEDRLLCIIQHRHTS